MISILSPFIGHSLIAIVWVRILLTRDLEPSLCRALVGLAAAVSLGGALISWMAISATWQQSLACLVYGLIVMGLGIAGNTYWYSTVTSPMTTIERAQWVAQVKRAHEAELSQSGVYRAIPGLQSVENRLAAARETYEADLMAAIKDLRSAFVPVEDAEAMFAAVWTAQTSDGLVVRSMGRGLEAWGIQPHEAVGGGVHDWPNVQRWVEASHRFRAGDGRPFVVLSDTSVTSYAPRPRDGGDLIVAVSLPLVGCEVFDDRTG